MTMNLIPGKDKERHFLNWFRMLPHATIPDVKALIVRECELKYNETGKRCFVLEGWIHGRVQVPPLAQHKINAIAGFELEYDLSHETVLTH